MARLQVCGRSQHGVLDLGVLYFQLGDEPLDPLALQPEVAAGRATTADDGKA
jgi:hypothetical protein